MCGNCPTCKRSIHAECCESFVLVLSGDVRPFLGDLIYGKPSLSARWSMADFLLNRVDAVKALNRLAVHCRFCETGMSAQKSRLMRVMSEEEMPTITGTM